MALEGERPTFLDQEEPGKDSVVLGLGWSRLIWQMKVCNRQLTPPNRSGSGGNKDSQCRRALQPSSA